MMNIEFISTEKAPQAVGPYSQGVKANNIIFTSGQLPIVPETGELVTDDIRKATKQSLDNVLAVVEAGGGDLRNIVKVNIYVKNMDDFGAVNEEYDKFFNGHKPARSCVEASRLPKGGIIEIEAIAVL